MTQYTEKDMTPFFPADVLPIHVGMYERKYNFWDGIDARDYWDGKNWFLCLRGYFDPKQAPIDFEPRKWRGLRFDPSAEAK